MSKNLLSTLHFLACLPIAFLLIFAANDLGMDILPTPFPVAVIAFGVWSLPSVLKQ